MLNLDINTKFRKLVVNIPYYLRHFLVELHRNDEDTCSAVLKGRYGTISEAMALVRIIDSRRYKKVLLISNAYHLRRIDFVMRRFISSREVNLIHVPVPEQLAGTSKKNWWRSLAGIRLILSEYLKLFIYYFVVPFYKRRLKYP